VVTEGSAAAPAAGLLGVAALVEVAATPGPPATFAPAVILALATTAPLAIGAARPALAAVTIAAAGVVALFSGLQPPVAGLLALGAAVYLAAVGCSARVLALLGLALAALGWSGRHLGLAVGLAAATTAVALTAGAVRRLRAGAAALDVSTRALSDTRLENRARGERARIARELHDVVAHHISLIALQADTVRLTTPGLPADGASGLVAIGDTARTALTEMRRLLGVLREDGPAEAELRPQPGLHELNDLVDAARTAGSATVRLIVRGAVRPLGPGVELTAYRIVQEALTNARRHAPGAGIDVDVRYGDDAVRVRVWDTGPGAAGAAGPGGHGVAGMRERAAMIGGRVTAGPADPAGYLVEAVLPTGGDRP
jgi:signal transduction histidine kinase